MNNWKVEAIERIIFTLPSNVFPLDIVSDVERSLGIKNCVLQLQCFMDRTYALTVCSSDAVGKLLTGVKLTIGRKNCLYRFCEQQVSRIRILHPAAHLKSNHIDSHVSQFGRIFYSEIERRSNTSCYFAIIDVKKPLPEKITIRRRDYDIVSF